MKNYSQKLHNPKLHNVDYYVINKKPNKLLRRFLVYSLLMAVIFGGTFYLNFKNKKFQESLNRQSQEGKIKLLDHWQKLLGQNQKSAEELFYMGLELAKKNLREFAALTFKEASGKDAHWRDAAYYTGYAYLQLANSDPPAGLSAAKAGEAGKQMANSQIYLEKAKEYLEKARDIDPIYLPTHQALLEVYQILGDEKNVELCYNKIKVLK